MAAADTEDSIALYKTYMCGWFQSGDGWREQSCCPARKVLTGEMECNDSKMVVLANCCAWIMRTKISSNRYFIIEGYIYRNQKRKKSNDLYIYRIAFYPLFSKKKKDPMPFQKMKKR